MCQLSFTIGESLCRRCGGITGLFEVLDRHAPLVSALKEGRVKVLKDKQTTLAIVNIHGGFVEVLNNRATVLAEGADVIEE